jgi:protein-tyrosine-phosphatase
MATGDRRSAQASAMAHPDRVQLLSLVLSAPTGAATVEQLAGTAAPEAIRHHLTALTEAGLLLEGPAGFRPTHDAIVRFGSLAPDAQPGPPGPGEHAAALAGITEALVDRYHGLLAPETVEEFVTESYDLMAARATIRRFLPQLTERFAIDRLDALASLDDASRRAFDDVLFVCVHNAGRSQIAAALMRAKVGDSVRIRTAGSAPSARLDPRVREELARRGLETLTEFPRPLTPEVVRASGTVITMGCGDACPVVPGRRYLDWEVDDPVGREPQDVRRIVEEISIRVDRLIAEMGVLRP